MDKANKIKRILISQPEPPDIDKSPYGKLISEFNLELTFYKFFDIVGVTTSEFRKSRIHLVDYTAVIFNSRYAVDNYFRLAKELRENIPDTMKYFCTSETISNYLQNYIQYRKRKVFVGQQFFAELVDVMSKHHDEKYLFPCSDEKMTEYTRLLDKGKYNYTRAVMYYSQPKDLKKFNLKEYDMIVLFSPIGLRAVLQSFPNIASEDIRIAALGTTTNSALAAAGLKVSVVAPTKACPSMAMAIENYLLGKEQGAIIDAKASTLKSKSSGHSTRSSASKRSKSIIVDKEKYNQLQEERKAQAAARRERKAGKSSSSKDDKK